MDGKWASRAFFAVTMIAIGLIGLIGSDFAGIWQPVPDTVSGREYLAYVCAILSLAAGGGLLNQRTAIPAALGLFLLLLIWTALFKVPFIIRAPLEEVSYQSNGENAVLIAAAWVLFAESAKERSLLGREIGFKAARILYGLALIAFGLSHFFYLGMTAPLVPTWLLVPVFWAYLTGFTYVAAGISLVSGVCARLGATAAAVQITLITLLVWTPMVIAGDMTAMRWQETIVSWALTASAWVMTTSFNGQPELRREQFRKSTN